MPFRSTAVAILVVIAAAATAVRVGSQPASAAPFTVHEWGTFTSIAGADGQAERWLPQGGVSDLPCFVERSLFNIKGNLAGCTWAGRCPGSRKRQKAAL
jgi:ABC-type amino acid transport substrate-binding protein